MIRFIFLILAALLVLTVLFWEKITEFFLRKFNIRLHYYTLVGPAILAIIIILLLLDY